MTASPLSTTNYLLFNSECSTCARLAECVEEAADGRLRALSLLDEHAHWLLDRAYPAGWGFAPYLVAVDGDRVRAWTGRSGAVRIARLLGPRRARRLWAAVKRATTTPPISSDGASSSLSRRTLLERSGLAAAGLILASLGVAVPEALASEPEICHCLGPCICGPDVTAAHVAHGQLHLELTFHAAGKFQAHILPKPPPQPSTDKLPARARRTALGFHQAGPSSVSFPLGTLSPGRYAVIVTPAKRTKTTGKPATWVYLTEHQGGRVTGIKLSTPS